MKRGPVTAVQFTQEEDRAAFKRAAVADAIAKIEEADKFVLYVLKNGVLGGSTYVRNPAEALEIVGEGILSLHDLARAYASEGE